MRTSYPRAGYLLGFALGGFFDGILLHQVLQWHHLLQGVEGAVFRQVRTQILADEASPAERDGSRRAVAVSIAAAVILAAPLAALPPAKSRQVAVLVLPSELNRLLDGISEMKGGILWANPGGTLWVLTLDNAESASRLYVHGALLVTRSPAALGCLAFARM